MATTYLLRSPFVINIAALLPTNFVSLTNRIPTTASLAVPGRLVGEDECQMLLKRALFWASFGIM